MLDAAGERIGIWRASLEEPWLAEIRTLAVARSGPWRGKVGAAARAGLGVRRTRRAQSLPVRYRSQRAGARVIRTARAAARRNASRRVSGSRRNVRRSLSLRHPRGRIHPMNTITIGGDLTVNRMGFGAMRIVGKGIWGPPPDREAAKNVLRHAVAHGVNFIDTADSYGPNTSEELIAEALAPYAPGIVIATKGGLTRSGPDEWHKQRAARAFAPSARGKSEAAASRLHRSLSVAPARSARAVSRIDRRARRLAARGQDPPRRCFERQPQTAGGGPRDRADRLGTESLQLRRPLVRRRARYVRESRHRVSALGAGRRSRADERSARSRA